MIFDLASMNGGRRYLYDRGTLYSPFTRYSSTYGDYFTVTNKDGCLELYYPIINNWFDYYTRERVDLTGFSKAYCEVTFRSEVLTNAMEFYVAPNPGYYYTNDQTVPVYSSVIINKSSSTITYEIDIRALKGYYYIGILNFPRAVSPLESVKITKIYLE